MRTHGKVLVAVDFSDDSLHAARRAALVAAQLQARLELLHVMSPASHATMRNLLRSSGVPGSNLTTGIRERLVTLAAELGGIARIEARAKVTIGDAREAIASAEAEAQLVVLGARGWNPLRDRILGTTAERLLRMCRRPVLVVQRQAKREYQRVIAALDYSPNALRALEVATRIAPQAQTTLVHVFSAPFEGKLRYAGVDDGILREYLVQARRDALAQMSAFLAQAPGDASRLSRAVLHGHPTRVLLDRAKLARADLLVVGKHGRSAAEEFFLGSVTRHILSSAKCDVLVTG
jgi:nucleotide-binding universal stress UspA family protein